MNKRRWIDVLGTVTIKFYVNNSYKATSPIAAANMATEQLNTLYGDYEIIEDNLITEEVDSDE